MTLLFVQNSPESGVYSWLVFIGHLSKHLKSWRLASPALAHRLVSARLLSGGIDDHAVVDLPNLKLKRLLRSVSQCWKARHSVTVLTALIARVEALRPGSRVGP